MGKIQNQLNQLMLSGLGGAIAYQHSPTTARKRTMKQDFNKLSTLATESGDIPFIKAFDPKLSKIYDKDQLQAIRDYMASGKEETDYETLMEAIGFDLDEDVDAETVQSRLESDILPAIKDYDDLIDMYEGSYKRFLSNLNPDELAEVISSNEYNGRTILPPHQLRQSGEEYISPLRTKEGLVKKFFSKDADIEAIGKQLAREDKENAKLQADRKAKEAQKAEAEALANRPFSQRVKDFLFSAQEAKKGVRSAVPERSILLKPTETVMENPGTAPFTKPDVVVKKPSGTVVKKGTVAPKLPETPDTRIETDLSILEKPGSRLYKG